MWEHPRKMTTTLLTRNLSKFKEQKLKKMEKHNRDPTGFYQNFLLGNGKFLRKIIRIYNP
jgi:hypothetical protein